MMTLLPKAIPSSQWSWPPRECHMNDSHIRGQYGDIQLDLCDLDGDWLVEAGSEGEQHDCLELALQTLIQWLGIYKKYRTDSEIESISEAIQTAGELVEGR